MYYSAKVVDIRIHVDIWDISWITGHTPDLHQFPRFTPDIHVDIWECACWDTKRIYNTSTCDVPETEELYVQERVG